MTKEKHKFNFSITTRIWDGVDKILNSALRVLKVLRFMEMASSLWSTFSFFYVLWHSSSVFSHHILCLCIYFCFQFSQLTIFWYKCHYFVIAYHCYINFCFFSLLHLMVLSDAFLLLLYYTQFIFQKGLVYWLFHHSLLFWIC